MTQGAWCCIRSERPAWPLAYLRDVEVSLFLWESSLRMPAWDAQQIASLSTVSNGEQSLVCPSPPYFGNPPLSKSRCEDKPWADESWDDAWELWRGWVPQRVVCSRQWLVVWVCPPPLRAGEITACVCRRLVVGNAGAWKLGAGWEETVYRRRSIIAT